MTRRHYSTAILSSVLLLPRPLTLPHCLCPGLQKNISFSFNHILTNNWLKSQPHVFLFPFIRQWFLLYIYIYFNVSQFSFIMDYFISMVVFLLLIFIFHRLLYCSLLSIFSNYYLIKMIYPFFQFEQFFIKIILFHMSNVREF